MANCKSRWRSVPDLSPLAPSIKTRVLLLNTSSVAVWRARRAGQKNDYNDAEAIAEAALRPNLRVVREKTQDQLD